MNKTQKARKRRAPHSKPAGKRRTFASSRGAMGAGMAYVVLATLVLFAAGSMMIGSIFPVDKPNYDYKQRVLLLSTTPEVKKDNLQLYYFPGATYTPTPSPTLPPEPDTSGGSKDSGSSKDGGKDGGSKSPDSGGGGGGSSSQSSSGPG